MVVAGGVISAWSTAPTPGYLVNIGGECSGNRFEICGAHLAERYGDGSRVAVDVSNDTEVGIQSGCRAR